MFYGFRDTRSQGYWTYWEHCDSEWKQRRPAAIPTFVQWRRSALNWKLQGDVSYAVMAKAVEKLIAFEAVSYWLRPLFQAAKLQLPAHIALELQQECPGLPEFMNRETSSGCENKPRSWGRLFNWGKGHVLSHAKKEGWLDCVLHQAGIHPRHARLVDYAALCCKSRLKNTAPAYPSLRQWQTDMEGYVRASRK